MKVIVAKDQNQAGKKAFEVLKNSIENGAKVLGLATGSSPLPLYKEIIKSDLDFSEMTSVNLDEYVGLSHDNPQSYHYFMQENLFKYKPFKKSYVPEGLTDNPEKECENYNVILKENPVDLQVLGIGRNGHIAFNEPGTSFNSTTHVVKLTESTLEANARFFDNEDEVPRKAICMGISNIMSSKEILLLAFGENKADAIKGMVEGEVTEELPASVLQNHPNVTVIVDEAAASKLSK